MSPAETFDRARSLAADGNARQAVLVSPDLALTLYACPDRGSLPDSVIRQMESIVPSSVSRNIAVVTSTDFAPPGESRVDVGSALWIAAGEALPFFGLLNGLACIGHSVWIFDRSADIEAACRDADLLIVDSEVLESIPAAALDAARQVMRNPQIMVHDRATFRLQPLARETGWA